MTRITTQRGGETIGSEGDRSGRLSELELEARREALRIRPLIEHPALRQAMGLDVATDDGLPRRHAGTHRTPGMMWPAASAAPAASATPAAKSRTFRFARRFDRRALLESPS